MIRLPSGVTGPTLIRLIIRFWNGAAQPLDAQTHEISLISQGQGMAAAFKVLEALAAVQDH